MEKKKKKNFIHFKIEDLEYAYQELDMVAGIDPPIDYDNMPQSQFEIELHDAFIELHDPADEWSGKTAKVRAALIEQYGEEVSYKKAHDKNEELDQRIAKERWDLKDGVDPEDFPAEPEIEGVDVEALMSGDERFVDIEKVEKEQKKQAGKVAQKKIQEEKSFLYNRIDALMEALHAKPKTMEEWAKEAEKLFKENKGKNRPSNFSEKNLTLQFLVALSERYSLGDLEFEDIK